MPSMKQVHDQGWKQCSVLLRLSNFRTRSRKCVLSRNQLFQIKILKKLQKHVTRRRNYEPKGNGYLRNGRSPGKKNVPLLMKTTCFKWLLIGQVFRLTVWRPKSPKNFSSLRKIYESILLVRISQRK